MKNKSALFTKWQPLLENAELPEIASSKQEIVAKILENQEMDFQRDPAYRDEKTAEAFGSFLNEAEIAGDHGYTANNIAAGQSSGAITNIAPAVMGMVRRAIPNLMAFDICGVQPMSGPTGQVFALRSVYGEDPLASGAKEAFHPMYAPDTYHSSLATKGATITADGTPFAVAAKGTAITEGEIVKHVFVETGIAYLQNGSGASITPDAGTELDVSLAEFIAKGELVEIAEGMATSIAELREGFNGSSNNKWNEMSFRIDKQVIEAKSRQLKAQYSIELAQDLRAVHGMDADSELSSILAAEVMVEINREVVNWINYTAQVGKTGMTRCIGTKAGVFDFGDPLDVRGARWAGESYKALLIQIDKEANEIARQTGRGAGNFIIASRNVVAAFSHTDAGVSVAQQGLASGMNIDTTKAVFAGVLGGKYKVYIDQYARTDYFTIGFKGASEMDAGLYYCPYVALTPLRGADPKNFQPVMGFKTRYGIGVNPFAESAAQSPANRISNGMPSPATIGKNAYFRRVQVLGL